MEPEEIQMGVYHGWEAIATELLVRPQNINVTPSMHRLLYPKETVKVLCGRRIIGHNLLGSHRAFW
jgi:hypothetical protein